MYRADIYAKKFFYEALDIAYFIHTNLQYNFYSYLFNHNNTVSLFY